MTPVRWSLLLAIILFAPPLSAQWQLVATPTSQQLYSVHGTPGNIIAGGTGFFLRSADNGASWDSIPLINSLGLVMSTYQTYDLHDRGVGVYLICGFDLSSGGNFHIWRTTNAGVNWSLVHFGPGGLLPSLRALDFDSNGIGLAAGPPGDVLRSPNGGSSWQLVVSTDQQYYDVAFDPYQTGRAAAVGNGSILRGSVNVQSWSGADAPTEQYRGVQFTALNTAYAVGLDGAMVRTTNGGNDWTAITTNFPGTPDLYDLHFINDQEGYVLAEDRVLRTVNGGLNWEWFPLEGSMNALHFISPTEGYAVGTEGRVYRMVPGGAYHPVAAFSGPLTACPGVPVSFTNLSAPGLSLQWLVNGVPAGTGATLDWTFTTPQQFETVALVVNNGTYNDTLAQEVNVGQVPATPILASAVSTVLCAGQSTQVVVTNSIVGGTYRLRRGTTVLAGPQSGNGGTLTFNTGAISLAFDTLNILVTRNITGCGLVEVQAFIPLQLDVPQVDLTLSTATPTVCDGVMVVVAVQDTESGRSYQLRLGNDDVGAAQNGTGGELQFSTGPNSTDVVYTMQVTTALGCVATLTQSVPVAVQHPEANWGATTVNPVVGVPFDLMNASVTYNGSVVWDIGPQGTPATSVLFEPQGVVFNSAGQYTVQLTVTTPIGCTATTSEVLHAIPPPPQLDCALSQLDHNNAISFAAVVEMDVAGNMYVWSSTGGATEVMITSGGPDSVFVDMGPDLGSPSHSLLMKFDEQGILQWTVRLLKNNSNVGDYGDIVIDSDGNLYLACELGSIAPLVIDDASGAVTTGSTQSLQILSFTSQGRLRWNSSALTGISPEGLTIALDGLGHLIVETTGKLIQLDRDTGDEVYSISEPYGFRDIALTPDDRILVTERFNMVIRELANDGTVLGSTPPVFATPPPLGLTRLNGWYGRLGTDGYLYQLHSVMGQVVIGTDTLVGSGSVAMDSLNTYFFMKRTQDGEVLWLRAFHMNSEIFLQGMELDDERLYLSLAFLVADTLHMQGLSPLPYTEGDTWLLSYDLDGGTPQANQIHAQGDAPPLANHIADRNCLAVSNNGDRMALLAAYGPMMTLGTDTAMIYTTWQQPTPTVSKHLALVFGASDCIAPPGNALPQAVFETPTNVCVGQPITFADASLNAPTAWNWSFPGGSPAFSTEPAVQVTYAMPGSYPVSLTVSNANGESDPYMAEVFVDVCTSVGEESVMAGWRSYPNPASTELWVSGPWPHSIAARCMDASGRLVWQGTALNGMPINIADWPVGIYVLELQVAESTERLPVMIVR